MVEELKSNLNAKQHVAKNNKGSIRKLGLERDEVSKDGWDHEILKYKHLKIKLNRDQENQKYTRTEIKFKK